MRTRGGEAAGSYFMPTQSDRCIAALRRWLSSHAPSGLPVPLPRTRGLGGPAFLFIATGFIFRPPPHRAPTRGSALFRRPSTAATRSSTTSRSTRATADTARPAPPRTTSDHLGPSRTTSGERCAHYQAAVSALAAWRKRTYRVLAAALLLGVRFWLARLVGVACLGLLRLYVVVEKQFQVGEYKHWQNH